MVAEKLCFSQKPRFSEDKLPKLVEKLRLLTLKFDIIDLNIDQNDDEFDYVSYQIGFVAKWLLENVFDIIQSTSSTINRSPIKMLSNDKFQVRVDNKLFPPVRSRFQLRKGGIYYFEITLISPGPVRIGWATNNCHFDNHETEQFGDDEHSIAFDGVNRCLWFDKKHYATTVDGGCNWRAGNIIGAMIDLNRIKFAFFYNGTIVKHEKKLMKKFYKSNSISTNKSTTYYAGASIGTHCHIKFNFGQHPFAYCLNKSFQSFHHVSAGNSKRYELLETSMISGSYWFKMDHNLYETIQPVFDDLKQNDFNRWVKELEARIIEFDYDYEYLCGELRWEFEALMKDEFAFLRLIQAIIHKLGFMATSDAINVVTSWIMYYLSTLDDTIFNKWFSDKHKFKTNATLSYLPALSKLMELIYPYMIEEITSANDLRLQRNTCIVLCIVTQKYSFFKNVLFDEVVKFILQILSTSNDHTCLLFALICLENLTFNQTIMKLIEKKLNVIQNLAYFKEKNQSNIYEKTFDHNKYQLATCARWFLNNYQIKIPRSDSLCYHYTLHWESRTDHMKLSTDLLSARSDNGWQSIRCSFPISSGIFYYETIMITQGPMRIGWTTNEKEFNKTNIGDSRQSIGFDRFQHCIWHNADRFKINKLPTWKRDDVIGCLIDIDNEKFNFFLNGVPIFIRRQIFKKINLNNSSRYFASVTLWPHQQCCFNFGQIPFKYPPKKAFQTFYSSSDISDNREFKTNII
ncbi:hypothetical protein RDWZM_001261 [Blomia tropicalis]|uniref:B30.2/SPRY domain-containing protein n=1 Tax=Blomia tropicalis TaxID=40697 RepID=A0A9Q0RR65_BLOTA|nr:hypothetical protein RDWZM_001261 [Blomia tropicalis]